MTKEKSLLIILLAIVCLFLAIIISKHFSNNTDIDNYKKAISLYQEEEYGKAYYYFSQISRFSDLKSAAIFRQARSANNVGDTDAAIKNYSILIKRYPDSILYPISKYYLAVLLYETGDSKERNEAKKHFINLTKKFKDTEVAIAAKYYLGVINNDSNLLLEYIKLSPTGRYAQNAIETLERFNTELTNKENLIIADSLLERGKYQKALKYYQKTNLPESWCGLARTLFNLGNYKDAKELTIRGLKDYSAYIDSDKIYPVIDCYMFISNSKLETAKYLNSINPKSKGADYILYLIAQNSPIINQPYIYETLYSRFPNGQFTGEALYKVFYYKLSKHKYDDAIKLGKIHLSRFSDTNSAPAVMFWMGKIYDRKNMKENANIYYKGVLTKYPDSYYAMRAYAKLHPDKKIFNKTSITNKPVIFPYHDKKDMNIALKLAELGDYDFVKELYKNDKFIESWIEYKKSNYTHSNLLAREAMNELTVKPDFTDVRWRLVYPIHYFDLIKKYSQDSNPIILLSIMKEESHFNPNIKSVVGASGLMQLMPTTANEIAVSYGLSNDLTNPENNIKLGSLYYSKIKKLLDDKDTFAIMAYNSGWGAVTNWKNNIEHEDIDDFIEKIPYPETKDYIRKVLKAYWNYSNIY